MTAPEFKMITFNRVDDKIEIKWPTCWPPTSVKVQSTHNMRVKTLGLDGVADAY